MKSKHAAAQDRPRAHRAAPSPEAKPLARTAKHASRRNPAQVAVAEDLEQPDAWGWYSALEGGSPGSRR